MKSSQSKAILLSLVAGIIITFYSTDINSFLEFETVKKNLNAVIDYYQVHPFKTLGIFVGFYILLTSLSIPGSIVLTLLSGAIFGVAYGTLVVTMCCAVGATIAFFLSRYLFRDAILGRFEKKYQMMNKKFNQHGKGYLFSLRLLPASPFVVINLLMGLTTIKAWTFFWVTFIGMLPGCLIYVYAGRKISEINSPNEILTWPVILLLTVLGFFPLILKHSLQFLKKYKKHCNLRSDYT